VAVGLTCGLQVTTLLSGVDIPASKAAAAEAVLMQRDVEQQANTVRQVRGGGDGGNVCVGGGHAQKRGHLDWRDTHEHP
jgi:hypothetical protein